MATIRKRGKSWQAQVRRKGHGSFSKSFHTKTDAQTWARLMEVKADQRELPKACELKTLKHTTLGELVQRYRDTITPRKRGADAETIVLNAFLRHKICGQFLSDIRSEHFAAYRDERLKSLKPASVKRQLTPLRHMFEVARSEWNLPITENPVAKIAMPSASGDERFRRLRDGEWPRLIRAASLRKNKTIASVIEFALETGMRRGEILAIQWKDLDQLTGRLTISNTKNGRSRTIPLSRTALGLIALQPYEGTRVFATSANAVRLQWKRICARARIEDLRFHDLRHEAISRFFERGLTLPEVALLSGHRDPRMLFRYTHPTEQRIRSVLDAAAPAGHSRPSHT